MSMGWGCWRVHMGWVEGQLREKVMLKENREATEWEAIQTSSTCRLSYNKACCLPHLVSLPSDRCCVQPAPYSIHKPPRCMLQYCSYMCLTYLLFLDFYKWHPHPGTYACWIESTPRAACILSLQDLGDNQGAQWHDKVVHGWEQSYIVVCVCAGVCTSVCLHSDHLSSLWGRAFTPPLLYLNGSKVKLYAHVYMSTTHFFAFKTPNKIKIGQLVRNDAPTLINIIRLVIGYRSWCDSLWNCIIQIYLQGQWAYESRRCYCRYKATW